MLAADQVKKGWAAPRTFRIVVAALLLCVLSAGGLLLVWGTRWTIPPARSDGQAYQFVAAWDGSDIPSGRFDRPFGIAVAPNGDVYVTDARKRIVRLGSTGQFKGQWGREGKEPGEFSNPVGIAVAADGSVFVSDYDLDRIQQFTSDGKFLKAFGSSGSGPGQLNAPAGLTIDALGTIYVADFYNHRVQKFGPDGSFQKTIGHPGRIGDGALHYPTDVRLAPHGQLLVADAYNYQIQRFDTDGQAMARLGYHLFCLWPRPVASSAGFNVPTGVAVDSTGFIHVADSGNHRVVMLSAKGEYLTEWKIPEAAPEIHSPEKIAVALTVGRSMRRTWQQIASLF
ncbi:MAG: NHL repeat-containing protein [Verrucomicrobiales bacterium]|nr:NHL repeat-containing protein [Verrucomicrobiales bacterium]